MAEPAPASDLVSAPAYGSGALADVGPSLLSALGVTGETNTLGLPELRRACLFVVDGLGWTQLRANPESAPYLSSLTGRPLTAGFPATTVTSLASLGTGLPPGEHGLPGYASYVEDVDAVVNWLAWRPVGSHEDLRDRLVPEAVQARTTVWERAEAAGVATTICTFDNFAGTGLTRAVLRGGRWGGTLSEGDAVARAAAALDRGHRSLVYVYVSALDLVGHMRGPHTDAWRAQLGIVDRVAEQLADRLPADATLFITADHGMVAVPEEAKLDYDATPSLQDDVVALAGEPRMRHVHVRRGAATDVLAAWTAVLGEQWLVLDRDDAIARGFFGPTVTTESRSRIGDVLALALGVGGVVERRKAPRLSAMPGQHGSLTDDELLIPLLSTAPSAL
ncbi:MAG TPA: alkaline phosphatase family protein [Mycobacteriales bacterium]|nr:alkaline phosphatase family protein [Mycobacteriales bacterium]